MSSCTIFFFVVIAEIACHSRVARCFKGFSLWKGTISLPSRRWLTRFRSSSTLPAQLFSVLGLLKTRKSRNREGPRTRRVRRETLFIGLRRDREWSRGENHLLVLPRDGPSSRSLPPHVTAPRFSSTDIPGSLTPFFCQLPRVTAVHPTAVLKLVFLSMIVRGYVTVVGLVAYRVIDIGILHR